LLPFCFRIALSQNDFEDLLSFSCSLKIDWTIDYWELFGVPYGYIRMDHHRYNFFFGRAGNAAEAEIRGKSYSKRLVMWKLDVNEIPLNTTRESYDSYSIK
jgi:hypothetical protein